MHEDIVRIVRENLELALQALEMGHWDRAARLAWSASLTITHRNDGNATTIVVGTPDVKLAQTDGRQQFGSHPHRE